MIGDLRMVEISISGRLDTLVMPWVKARENYVRKFYGDAAVQDAEHDLLKAGKWSGRCEGGTLYVKLTDRPNFVFLSGDANPLFTDAIDRRFMVVTDKPEAAI